MPKNVTLLPLPPYRSERNAQERVWAWMRSHPWSNRFYDAYDAYDALMAAACEAWDRVSMDAELIKSVYATPALAKRAD